jgi:hypothetical protein
VAKDRINRQEFTQRIWDQLQTAIDEQLFTVDELRAMIAILEPAAERVRQRGQSDGPSSAEVECN